MRRNKAKKRGEAAKLEMTPMIDVVFQLLIFFIVTLKQEDILSKLNVSRPAPNPERVKPEDIQDLVTITVLRNGYFLKERPVSFASLGRYLNELASYSKTISVIIKCTPESRHAELVKLLNICAKEGLTRLSVFSI